VSSKDDERRLVIAEQFDFKQDKSLSSVRLVCKNAGAILRRKDSSGSILRDGSAKKGSFVFNLSKVGPVTLQPGLNAVVVEAAAGPVGRYEVNQMSIEAGEEGKLDFVFGARSLRAEASFSVVSEPPTISIVTSSAESGDGGLGALLAGVEQEVKFSVHSGSRHVKEVS
jgi:hypothetical protein